MRFVWSSIFLAPLALLSRNAAIDGDVLSSHESGVNQVLHCLKYVPRPSCSVYRVVLGIVFCQLVFETGSLFIALFALVRYSNSPGRNEIDSNPPLGARGGHGVHQANLTGFTTCVALLIWIALERSKRPDEDNTGSSRGCVLCITFALCFHVWDAGGRAGERCGEVRFEVRLPLLKDILRIFTAVSM